MKNRAKQPQEKAACSSDRCGMMLHDMKIMKSLRARPLGSSRLLAGSSSCSCVA